MHRKSLATVLAVVAVVALGVFASAASAKAHVPRVVHHFTEGPEGGGEYFGETNTLTCHGVHISDARYPAGINPKNGRETGGEEITHCKLAKGETFPARWQSAGAPIDIDGNNWVSGYDGEQAVFSEIYYSKVNGHDNAFVVKVAYPLED
jgi:hypothetical protein